MKKQTKYVALVIVLFAFVARAQEQCFDFDFTPSSTDRVINWSQFDGIDLPFTLVYDGPPLSSPSAPLQYGFTHLGNRNFHEQIDPSQRALVYYGVAYPNQSQPWEVWRSPWGNDMNIYEQKWQNDLDFFKSSNDRLDIDLFVFDIERQWRTDFDILQFSQESSIPEPYASMDSGTFINSYKNDLRAIYAKPLSFFESSGSYTNRVKVSSYSDAPVWNTFDNIQGASWNEWQSQTNLLNYICTNENGNIGGEFETQLDFITPSTYYYYDYPHPFAGEYLSYLLFQIEANKAWTQKPVIPFIWMRYSFNSLVQNQFIKPWMAEATAIFPFMSGADGLWLWESPLNFNNIENFSTYEYFLKGLRRLSEFKAMFEGEYELVIETSARDYNENKQPIWRGIFKNNELLVAAHNPHASDENQEVIVPIRYRNFQTFISLKGYETKLCKFDLTLLALEEASAQLNLFPNPAYNSNVTVEVPKFLGENLTIKLIGIDGKVWVKRKEKLHEARRFELQIPENASSECILQVEGNAQKLAAKIIK